MKKRGREEIAPEITEAHTRLYKAICAGNISTVEQCLEFSSDVNILINNSSLLFHAISKYSEHPENMTPIIIALIKAGANIYQPNHRGSYCPITYAMSRQTTDLLSIMCIAIKLYCEQNQKDMGEFLFPALRKAIDGKYDPEMVKVLLESGASPNPGDDAPSLLYEVFIKDNSSAFISRKIQHLIAHGLAYEKQIKYTKLDDYCREYEVAAERSSYNGSQETLLDISIAHRQFEVLNGLVTSLQKMGVQPAVSLYEDLIHYAAYNQELSHADITIILSHTIKDDFTENIFKTLVMIRWPIENLLHRLSVADEIEISGVLLTECLSLIKQRLEPDPDREDDEDEEEIDSDEKIDEDADTKGIQRGDEYLFRLFNALSQAGKLPDNIVDEGEEFYLTIPVNRQDCNQSMLADAGSESDLDAEVEMEFRAVMNPISYAVYANYSKTLKLLLKKYPDDVEQTLGLLLADAEFSNVSLLKLALLCKSFDSLKTLIECGAKLGEISAKDLAEAPAELLSYWKSVCNITMIEYDPAHLEALWSNCPIGNDNFYKLHDLIDSYRSTIYSDNKTDRPLIATNINLLIQKYKLQKILSNLDFSIITIAHKHLDQESPEPSQILIMANNRVNENYTKHSLFCYFKGTYYYLPANYREEDYLKKMTTRLLTKFTYHIALLKLKSIRDINQSHNNLWVMRSILYRVDSDLEKMDLSQLLKYQEQQETALEDFFGEELSDNSDEEEESIFTKNMPMVIRMTRSYATELQELAQVEKLRIGKTGKSKMVGDIPIKAGDLKLMLEHSKGVILREKDDPKRPKFLTTSDLKFEAHKRVINSGTVDFKSYPIAKIQIPGHKFKNSAELEAHAQSELDNLNRLCLQGKFLEATKQIKAPFSIAVARGIHYSTNEWTANARRQHRKADEIGKPHFAAAVYEKLQTSITTDLTALDVDEQQQMLASGKDLAQNLLKLKQEGQDSNSQWHMFYAAFQQLYTGKYEEFHRFLEIAMFNTEFSVESDRLLADKLKAVLFNAKNPHLSSADSPHHAIRYALGLKSYPGQFDTRLRPRYRKDGTAERSKTGKVYIYLFNIDQYLQLNPNHVTSMAKVGEIDVISTIRPERETSFFGYIPEGALIIQYVAKYPSFDGDYRQIYHHKYGLDEVLYNLFKKDILASPPHSDKRRSVKLLLGEWLSIYHEVRLLREIVHRVKDDGRLLLYRGLDMPFRFSPPDVTTRNNAAGAQERAVNKNPKTASWVESMNGFFSRGTKVLPPLVCVTHDGSPQNLHGNNQGSATKK
jgi:hypothetical protein